MFVFDFFKNCNIVDSRICNLNIFVCDLIILFSEFYVEQKSWEVD